MGHHKFFYHDGIAIRNRLNEAVDLATQMHEQEEILIRLLHRIDQRRLYVRFGYNSLMGFCRSALRFSKMQSQRIATRVRRYEPTEMPTDKIMDEGARRTGRDPTAFREKVTIQADIAASLANADERDTSW